MSAISEDHDEENHLRKLADRYFAEARDANLEIKRLKIELIMLAAARDAYCETLKETLVKTKTPATVQVTLAEARAERAEDRANAAEAALAKTREALKPFAEHDDFHVSDDWAVTQTDDGSPDPIPGVTAGDFRRAKIAYASLIKGEREWKK